VPTGTEGDRLKFRCFEATGAARRKRGGGALVFLLLALTTSTAAAAVCGKNTHALGTERTITVDPGLLSRVGTSQYSQTLPLREHEVVLTFDDGPSSSTTGKVLDALAEECASAIFFVVGERVAEAPALVLRAATEGHAIGTHTQTHAHLADLKPSDAEAEIRAGVAAVAKAFGPDRSPAPFFRAPYLETSFAVEEYLRERGLMLWGIDVDSEDWRGDSPDAIIGRVLRGLDKLRKGIILMHDVQPCTADTLPRLLTELRVRGYKVVRVLPATRPRTMAKPALKGG
jgi:peptidoglycan-N-acetylglucosamine deacetylase